MKHRLARLAPLLALVALGFALSAGCGDDDDDGAAAETDGGGEDLRSVTLMLDWTPNTNHSGIYVAQDKGWYEEQGLRVDIIEPAAGGTEQAVAGGQAQFGISVQEQVIPARQQGIPVVSIAAIIQHNTSSLMSLAEDGIERPADLPGHTYGGFGGALETALIRTLVTCDGGDPDGVEFVEVGNADYLVGMEEDQFDVVWIFDAWDGLRATDVEQRDVNFIHFADWFDCIPDWYTPVFITSQDMIESDPDTVRAFMEATSRGYEFAMENPEETADILLRAAPELDERLVRASAEWLATRYVDEGRQWGLQDREVWDRFHEFVLNAGLIEEPIDVEAAYTNDFLPDNEGSMDAGDATQ
ncbi:MAG TPA: ABC transporter substrate-binding protein [Dehalococcoidia bacterium]|nr:ABC transporter substrate-binding protein [Dehalococcoidia bacterium]